MNIQDQQATTNRAFNTEQHFVSHSSREFANLQIKYISYQGLWLEKLYDLNSEKRHQLSEQTSPVIDQE